MTLPITALILTYNEELHIARCLRSLEAVATRMVVVDSFSTDRTVEIAKSLGAEVFQNPWTTHAGQFQWGLENCDITTDWTLRIDADEYLDFNLRLSIHRWFSVPKANVNGLFLRRKIIFLGKPITHGFFYPLKILRLWRTSEGRMEQRRMDEHIVLNEAVTETLSGDLVDENLNDLSWWIQKHDKYALLEAQARIEGMATTAAPDNAFISGQAARKRFLKEKIYTRVPPTLRTSLYFFYRYIVGMGFLDGKAGFYFHFLQAYWYRTLVEAKMYEIEQRSKKVGASPYELLKDEGVFSNSD